MIRSPVVSVIIPAYNAASYLGKAIDSALAQDFDDFELIVVDDGSTDSSASVLQPYRGRIRILRQANGGMSSARNAGVREARGEFIAFLDADDWWLPQKLARQVELMVARPALGFASATARVEDPDGRLLNLWDCGPSPGDPLRFLFASNRGIAGGTSALMVRRTLLEQIGGYDEGLGGFEDADLWMRLAAITDYGCIPEPLLVVLRRSGSVSRNVEAMRHGAIRVRQKNRHLLPKSMQSQFWRTSMANVYGDFAKWRYRAGQRRAAIADVFRLLALAPITHARLGLGLLRDMLFHRTL